MVVQVIGSLRGGGAERVAITLHKAFKKLNQESKIIVLNKKIDYEIDEDIIFEDLSILKNAKLIIAHMDDSAKILQEYKNKAYFVIHTTLGERLKRKNIFSRFKQKKQLQKVYNNSNIIAVSNGIKKDLQSFINANIKVIYNPFDFEEIKKLGNENIDLDFNYMITAGSLNKVKRHDLLLKAYAKLNTNLHLVILGKGGQEKNLKNLAKKLKIEKKVHFLGWQSNPYKYIKNAKLFVLSSEVEGFGNVLIESLALNTPVVSTNCPSGPNEILIDKLSQFLAKNQDEFDLLAKMELALKNYPQIKKEYYERFDYIKIAKEYLCLK